MRASSLDPLSLIKAVDICAKLSSDWHAKVDAKKWTDKQDAIRELHSLIEKNPRIIVSKAFHEVMVTLKKYLHDAQVVIVGLTMQVMVLLSNSLKKEFAPSARTLLAIFLDFFKEKKGVVSAPLNELLDSLLKNVLDFSDMCEPVLTALDHKVDKVVIDSMAFLKRSLTVVPPEQLKTFRATIGKKLVTYLSASNSAVRADAITCLGVLTAVCGEKAMSSLLSQLQVSDVKKHGMILKACQQHLSGGGVADGAATASFCATAPAPVKTMSRPTTSVSMAAPSPAPEKSAAQKKASTKSVRRATETKNGTSVLSSNAEVKKGEAVFEPEGRIPFAQTKEQAEQLLPCELVSGLASTKWQEVVEALSGIEKFVRGMSQPGEAKQHDNTATVKGVADAHLNTLFYYLEKVPSFNHKNVNVQKSLFNLLSFLCAESLEFSKSLAYLPLSCLLGKLSERTTQAAAEGCLMAFCDAVGPQFITTQITLAYVSLSNPKSQAAAISFIAKCVTEYGVCEVPLKKVLDSAKTWLAELSKPVRDAASELCVAIYTFIGPQGKELITSGLKPATQSGLEAAFAQVPAELVGNASHKRVARGGNRPPAAGAKGAKGGAAGALAELMPQVDLAEKITPALLAQLAEKDWKDKKAGLDSVMAILEEAHHSIKPKDGGLCDVIKRLLCDKNANVVKQTLTLVTQLIQDMGDSVSRYVSRLTPGVLANLGNSQTSIRDEAFKAFSMWIQVCGPQSLFPSLAEGLTSLTARPLVLAGLESGLETADAKAIKRNVEELKPLVKPMLSCLSDKSKTVQGSAVKVLCLVVKFTGFDFVQSQTSGLAKATVLAIQGYLETVSKAYDVHVMAAEANKRSAAQAAKAAPKLATAPAPVAAVVAPALKEPSKELLSARRPTQAAAGAPSARRVVSKKSEPRPEEPEDGSEGGRTASGLNDAQTLSGLVPCMFLTCPKKAKAMRLVKEAKTMRSVQSGKDLFSSDELQALEDAMAALCCPALNALLFSKRGFNDWALGADFLAQAVCVAEHQPAMVMMLDLLLKWSVWRLSADAQTALALKLLDFLDAAVGALAGLQYRLEEGEAAVFLGPFIECILGHNNPKFRQRCGACIHALCEIYAPPKVFAALACAWGSKNKRVVAECLTLAAELVSRLGLEAVAPQPAKLARGVAALVGDSDKNVRFSSLTLLETLHSTVGADAFMGYFYEKGVCKVPTKNMAMIEARVKTVAPAGPARPASSPEPLVAISGTEKEKEAKDNTLRSSVPAFRAPAAVSVPLAAAEDSAPAPPTPSVVCPPPAEKKAPARFGVATPFTQAQLLVASPTPTPAEPEPDSEKVDFAPIPTAVAVAAAAASSVDVRALVASAGPTDGAWLRCCLSLTEHIEEPVRMEAIRVVWEKIYTADRSAQPARPELGLAALLRPCTDEVVSAMVRLLATCFAHDAIAHRVCRYALNILMEVFKTPAAAQEVRVLTLERLVRELLMRLMDERIRNSLDCKPLCMALNMLMVTVLSTCDRTSAFHVLLKALRDSYDSPGANNSAAQPAVDLVVKCLMKLSKALPSMVSDLNLAFVLKGIHEFFQAHEAAPAASQQDLALKAVRIVLGELHKLKGPLLLPLLATLPEDAKLVHYVKSMDTYRALKNVNKNVNALPVSAQPALAPISMPEADNISSATSMPAESPKPAAPQEVQSVETKEDVMGAGSGPGTGDYHSYLTELFVRLRDTQVTAAALKELFEFTKTHPHVDVDRYIDQTSPVFQRYLRRGLEKLKASAQARGPAPGQ